MNDICPCGEAVVGTDNRGVPACRTHAYLIFQGKKKISSNLEWDARLEADKETSNPKDWRPTTVQWDW